jgi:hypothetical protein
MEQFGEQSSKQSPEQPPRPWWQWKPGQSGNPAGKRSRQDRIRAEADRLTAEFVRLHDRAPDGFEVSAIGGAAVLCERLAKPPLDVEGLVKLQNALARALQRLGMGKAPPNQTAPLPSGREILQRRNSR